MVLEPVWMMIPAWMVLGQGLIAPELALMVWVQAWDMPTKTDVVDNDAVFSTGQVERLLVKDALCCTQDAEKGTTAFVLGHPNNAFWDWPSEPVLESEKRDNLRRR